MPDLSTLNWTAIVAAAVVSYAGGMVWYAPMVFGKIWLKTLGKTKESLGSPTNPMIVGFIVSLLVAVALALLFKLLGVIDPVLGAKMGLFIGVAFGALNVLSDSLFFGTPIKLFWIQQGYRVIGLVIMGAILGGWK